MRLLSITAALLLCAAGFAPLPAAAANWPCKCTCGTKSAPEIPKCDSRGDDATQMCKCTCPKGKDPVNECVKKPAAK